MVSNREFILRLFLIIASVFLIFCIAEVGLGLSGYYYTPLKIQNLGREIKGLGKCDFRKFHAYDDKDYVFDPGLIWRPKNSYGFFNAQGFRGSKISIPKENDYYIFTLGDSDTFGWREKGSHWPGYLERLLRKDNPKIKVVNAGIPGYSLFQGHRRFKEILEFKPDMIIMGFGANDGHRVTISDKEYVSSKKFFESNFYQSRVIQLLIAFCDIVMVKAKGKNKVVPRVSLEDFEYYLNDIITRANRQNIRVILLTRHFAFGASHELSWKNFTPHYNKITSRVSKERDISLVDIHSYFQDRQNYFVNDSHLSDEGYRIVANLIYDKIRHVISK